MARKTIKFNTNPLLSGPTLANRARSGSPYRELLIDEIELDPDQPRRVFDEEKLNELASSIREHGVLAPILVRITEGGNYRLITGERRLRASKLAGLETIPAVIEQGEFDGQAKLSKQLVENLQRSDLTPMERALALGQLRDAHKWSIRQIATKLGVSKAFVQRSLEILALPDDLQAALINGASESKIFVLANIQNRDLRAEFVLQLENFTRDQLEQEVRRVQLLLAGEGKGPYHGGTVKAKRGKTTLSEDDERLVSDIQKSLRTKVELARKSGRAGQGKLSIEFYSDGDLQELYRRLV